MDERLDRKILKWFGIEELKGKKRLPEKVMSGKWMVTWEEAA